MRQGTKLSAPARHLISSILVLLVAPFPGAHGTANSDAGAIYLVGVLLPYVQQTSLPDGFAPGVFGTGAYLVAPIAGSIDPFDYLIGSHAAPTATAGGLHQQAAAQRND